MTTTAPSPQPATGRRTFAAAQVGLSLLAASVFVVRAVRTAAGDGLPAGQSPTAGVLLAGAVTLLTLGAAVLAFRSIRLAGVPLAVALVLELSVLGDYVSPPRLLAAIPLIGALAVAAVPPSSFSGDRAGAPSRTRQVLTAVSFLLMAPIGFFYLTTGLVAPAPDVFAAYALFAAFAAAAVALARRRSWWVLAVPLAALGAWFLMLWLGGSLRGWSG